LDARERREAARAAIIRHERHTCAVGLTRRRRGGDAAAGADRPAATTRSFRRLCRDAALVVAHGHRRAVRVEAVQWYDLVTQPRAGAIARSCSRAPIGPSPPRVIPGARRRSAPWPPFSSIGFTRSKSFVRIHRASMCPPS
jgi:hypothetical protein